MKQLGFDFAALATHGTPVSEARPGDATAAPRRTPPQSPSPANDRLDSCRGLHTKARALSTRLSQIIGTQVEVQVTDNRRMMLSSKRKRGYLQVRLHHMFLDAGDEITGALARYLCSQGRADGALIDAYVAANRHRINEAPRRRVRVQPQGRVYNLQEFLEELRPSFEEDMSKLRITWGRHPAARRRQRSLQLGAYSARDALIRVHRVLDQAWVPRWYVATVVFHEMLHHALPTQTVGGIRRHHTRAFRERERQFVHHDAACAWEAANLPRLLASIRKLPC